MKVADHESQTWFLLEESGRYYFDARVTRSAAEWSVLIQLTPQEYREYHAIGRLYLCYLAARIHNFVDEYSARDLSKELGEKVTRAVQKLRTNSQNETDAMQSWRCGQELILRRGNVRFWRAP